MTNQEKYNNAFLTTLQIGPETLGEALIYQSIATWDSVGHMTLIASLEEAFSISMDIEDIIDFSSYEKGKDILGKYGLSF